MVWKLCGGDILVSLLVCSIKGEVPEGGAWKRRRMRVVPGRKRGTSYVSNFVSLDGFVRLCFI